jgi:bifunctional DNase/RNase
MIPIELSKIIIDEKRQDQIIILKEKEGTRQFPIVIGVLEASSIKMKLSKIEPPRPMTHDLLSNVIVALGAKVNSLIIDELVDNTFHSKIELKMRNGRKKQIDARPSDGVALAVRANADIFVTEEVLERAAIFKAE